jgi:proline iminopeptidase
MHRWIATAPGTCWGIWSVFGRTWVWSVGSCSVAPGGQPWATLGLAYAETSPERVSALVLRGIFLCRPWEIRWFYQQGANLLFPDHWQDLVAPIPEAERDDLVHAYHRRLTGTDDSVLRDAALAGSIWEGRCATLLPDAGVRGAFADDRIARSLPRIECHYFVNDAFLTPDQLL